MSHRTLTAVAATTLIAALVTTAPVPAQVRVEKAPGRADAITLEGAIPLEDLTPETLAELDDGSKIVHGGREITVGQMKAAAEARRVAFLEFIARADVATQTHLETRRREISANEAVRRDAEIAAANQALEELAQRARKIRPVKRRVLRRNDG